MHDTLAALFGWRGLAVDALNGHRDCNSPKTCPGRAIQLPVACRAGRCWLTSAPAALSSHATIGSAPRCTQAQALAGSPATPPAATPRPIWRWRSCRRIERVYRRRGRPAPGRRADDSRDGNLTSWWAQRPLRNPAGIGVTGVTSATRPIMARAQDGAVWREGCLFADWANAAILAHVGRLLAYATQPSVRDGPFSATWCAGR